MAGALSSRVKRMMSGEPKKSGVNMFELMEPRQMLSGASVVANEFTVNSSSGLFENQANATVGYAADGSFVVAWDGPGSGDSTGIFAQRYNSSGAKVGGEFRVNTHVTSGQSAASIAVAADGSFIVAWHGRGTGETGSDSVYFQRYNSAGSTVGGNVRANSYTTGSQVNASIGIDSTGGFVIAWHGDGPTSDSGNGIFARRFDSAGSAVGSEFLVNSSTANDQEEAAVAVASDGSFIVAWEGDGSGESQGIYFQRYNSSGAASGSNTLVNADYTTGGQDNPAIALKASGEFLIVWDGAGAGDTGEGIFGQRYDTSGSAVGSNFRANSYVTGNQNNATVGWTAEGGFVVAWNGEGSGDSDSIYAQVFYSNGAADGSAFRVNQYDDDAQVNPALAVNGSSLIIAWDGNQADFTSNDVVARRYTLVPNSAPTVSSAISDVTVDEDAVDTTIDLTTKFTDVDQTSATLTYSVISNSNSALVSTSIASGVLTLDFAADEFGTATITVQATDTAGATVTDTFDVTVESVNDAPTFSATDPAAVDEDTGVHTLTGWATANLGPANESETATYTVEVISGGSILSSGPSINANGDLTYTLAGDEFGTVSFKVQVSDGTDVSDWETFSIVVNNVNDLPSFWADSSAIEVDEDAGAQSITGWANANLGPANENETATYTVVITSGAELINGDIEVDANGTLTFTPADNEFGTVEFTVKVSDGTAETSTQSFSIEIASVNDAPDVPTLATIPTVVEDTVGLQTVTGFASSDIGPSNEDPQTLSFDFEILSGADKVTGLAIDASGNLTYTLVANAFGEVVFRVRAYDGFDYSDWAADATITITGVNDAPVVFGDPLDVYIDEDAGAQNIEGWVTFDLGGNNNEGETAVFTLTVTEGADLLDSGPSIDSTGKLSFTPKDDAFGTIIFNLKLSDGSLFTVANGFIIEIAPINDAPSVKAADPDAVNEDAGAQEISGWMDVSSPDNELPETYIYEIATLSGGANLSSGPTLVDGTLSFTPAADAFGEVVFKARVGDGTDFSSWVCYTITINSVNDLPSFTATSPSAVAEDSGAKTVTGWATANLGPANEGETATYTVEVLSGGSILTGDPTVNSAGDLSFTPAANEFGTVSFKVQLSDGTDTTDWQTFSIVVNNVNDLPSFLGEINIDPVDEDSGLNTVTGWATFDLGANNNEGETPNWIIHVSAGGSLLVGGTPSIDANGNLSFTPAPDQFGLVTFTVKLSDGTATTKAQAFVITIDPVNDAPTFTADDQTVDEDSGEQTVTGWATANLGPSNEAPETATYTVEITDGASLLSGGITIDSSGTLVYTPAADAFGVVTFKAQVSDGTDSSSWTTHTITIENVNDAPSFTASNPANVNEDAGEQTVTEWATANLGPANENETAQYTVEITDGADLIDGDITVGSDGTLTFTPAANAFGTVTFTVTLSDGTDETLSQEFTLEILPVNDAPTFTASDISGINEDTGAHTVTGWATANLGPANEQTPTPETATYTVNVLSGGDLFSVAPAVDSDGTLTYTLAADAFGTAEIAVRVNDGTDNSDWQCYTITIDNVNDHPTWTAVDPADVMEDSGTTTISNWANFNLGPANENETATFTVEFTSGGDILTGLPTIDSNGELSFTPAANMFGEVVFTVSLSDGTDKAITQSFIIDVLPVNDAPTFSAGDETVDEDAGAQSLTGWATANLGPANEQPETATYTVEVTDGADLLDGTVAVDTDGTLTFTPAANANGTVEFKVQLSDGTDTSSWQCYSITINAVNDAPTFTASNPATVTEDSGAHSITGWATANLGPVNEAPETATYTVTFVSGSEKVTGLAVDSAGTLSYTLVGNAFGDVVFKVSVSDGTDSSAEQEFTLSITGVNDAPSLSTPVFIAPVAEDAGPQTITGWATFDLGGGNNEGETATFTIAITKGAALIDGAISVDSSGNLHFTSAKDAFGEVTFTVKLSDGTTSTPNQARTITIDPVNDAPTILTANTADADNVDGGKITISGFGSATSPANELPETYTYGASVTAGDSLLSGGTVSINSSTGDLEFTPVDINTDGVITVKLSATDNHGATSYQSVDITIHDKTRPTVTSVVSSDAIGSRDSVTVTFSEAIDVGSFDWESITLTRDGGANLIDSGTGVTITLDSGTTYIISGLAGVTNFVGSYTLTLVDEGVTDGFANTLNGADSTTFAIGTVEGSTPVIGAGLEGVTGWVKTSTPNVTGTATPGATIDIYEGSNKVGSGVADASGNYDVTITLANGVYAVHAVASSPSNTAAQSGNVSISVDTLIPTNASMSSFPTERTNPVLTVAVRFSAKLDLSTFDFNDISLTRNGNPVDVTGFTIALTNPSNHTYTITMPASAVNTIGSYNLTVTGAGILNQAHNAVSNNRSSTWTIVAAVPSAPSLDVASEGKAGSGYTQSTTPTVKGTGSVGSTIEVYEGLTLLATTTVAANGTYSVTLPTLSVGAHVIKTRAVEGAGAAPTAYSSEYTITVETATPTIANMSAYPTPRTVAVSTTAVRFTSTIDLSTVSAADFTLTRDGVPVTLSSITIVESNPTTHNYTVTLPTGSNDAAGVYVLTVTGAGIKNLAGATVGNNFSTTWTLLPKVVSMSTYPTDRVIPVTLPGIRFSSPINLATFTWEDITLTRNGGANLITSAVTISLKAGETMVYNIALEESVTLVAGSYVLTVTGSGVQSTTGLTVSNNGSTTWTQL